MYKIFELIGKDRLVPDGYYTKTVTTYKLEKVDLGFTDKYPSVESAMEVIRNKRLMLQVSQLVILPVVQLDYEGNIVE